MLCPRPRPGLWSGLGLGLLDLVLGLSVSDSVNLILVLSPRPKAEDGVLGPRTEAGRPRYEVRGVLDPRTSVTRTSDLGLRWPSRQSLSAK